MEDKSNMVGGVRVAIKVLNFSLSSEVTEKGE